MIKFYSLMVLAIIMGALPAQAFTFNDIDLWAGSGGSQAGLVVHWSAPEVFNKTSMPAPVAEVSYAWGYRFDGNATAEDMLQALAAADPNLYVFAGGQPGLGMAVFGIGYDYDRDGQFGLSNGSITYTAGDFTGGLLADRAYGDGDNFKPTDSGDLYWGGWFGPNWELWHEQGGNGGFDAAPDRGPDTYFTKEGFFGGHHGEWDFSGSGITSLELKNGSWVGWSVAAGGLEMENFEGPGTQAYMNHKQAPASPVAAPVSAVPLPSASVLLFSGILALGGFTRRAGRSENRT